jgi:hypothetical protein
MLDDLGTHLTAGALAHAQDVFDLLGFESRNGVGAGLSCSAAIWMRSRIASPENVPQMSSWS